MWTADSCSRTVFRVDLIKTLTLLNSYPDGVVALSGAGGGDIGHTVSRLPAAASLTPAGALQGILGREAAQLAPELEARLHQNNVGQDPACQMIVPHTLIPPLPGGSARTLHNKRCSPRSRREVPHNNVIRPVISR
jgi:hypothetical protein